MIKSKGDLVRLEATKYKQIFMDWRASGMQGGFGVFDKELGLDYMHSDYTIDSHQYTFEIKDQKQFFLAKIKYGI